MSTRWLTPRLVESLRVAARSIAPLRRNRHHPRVVATCGQARHVADGSSSPCAVSTPRHPRISVATIGSPSRRRHRRSREPFAMRRHTNSPARVETFDVVPQPEAHTASRALPTQRSNASIFSGSPDRQDNTHRGPIVRIASTLELPFSSTSRPTIPIRCRRRSRRPARTRPLVPGEYDCVEAIEVDPLRIGELAPRTTDSGGGGRCLQGS